MGTGRQAGWGICEEPSSRGSDDVYILTFRQSAVLRVARKPSTLRGPAAAHRQASRPRRLHHQRTPRDSDEASRSGVENVRAGGPDRGIAVGVQVLMPYIYIEACERVATTAA